MIKQVVFTQHTQIGETHWKAEHTWRLAFRCVMEVWWKNREDFENSLRLVSDPERLPYTIEDEKKFFATHSNPVCTVEEVDSPVGPDGVIYDWVAVPKA